MRAFAFLSLAAAAFAAPALVPGSVATVVAPVTGTVGAVAGVAAHAHANSDASIGNVNAAYNNIADNTGNNNHVKIARGVSVQNNNDPIDVNAKNPASKAASSTVNLHHTRDVATVVAPVVAVLKGLVGLCTKVGVDANAAIANIGLNYNNILNDAANKNSVNVGKGEAADAVARTVACIIALIKGLVNANVDPKTIVSNVASTCHHYATNNAVPSGSNPAVAPAPGSLVGVAAPVVAVIRAVIPIIAHVCAELDINALNVALSYNNIANNVGNGNSVSVL